MGVRAHQVLVVEDNPVDARLIRARLESGTEEFEVHVASSLAEGLRLAKQTPPDLVLLDLTLPDSSGLDTLAGLKAAVSGVPTVVLSGLEDEAAAREAVACGAQDYLVKGRIDAGGLQRALHYALERHRFETDHHLMERELSQARKLEAIGQLAAGIAHEINTPTQYVSDNARFLQESFRDLVTLLESLRACVEGERSPSPAELRELLESADVDYLVAEIPRALEQSLQGLAHVSRIVRAMKEFSHPASEEKSLTDLNRALETTVLVASNEWKYVAEIVTELDPELPAVACLPGEINQVFLNLLVNAAHAVGDVVRSSGEKGRITVSTRRGADGFAEVRIADTGTGIPPEHREKVFDPFFTTKDVGKGTGQGLSIAYGVVVKKHAGTIDFESTVGVGTTFLVRLPLPATAEASAAA